MTVHTPLKKLFSRSREQLKLAEIEPILELLPYAAILGDLELNEIYLVNSQLIALTTYTRSELSKLPLDHLLMLNHERDSILKHLRDCEDFHPLTGIILRNRNDDYNQVEVRIIHLNADRHLDRKLAILSIQPDNTLSPNMTETERYREIWGAMEKLLAAPQETQTSNALQKALEATREISKCGFAVIYHADAGSLNLFRGQSLGSADELSWLPDQISPQDFIQLRKPLLWLTKNRPNTVIQRAARKAQLDYLASVPLGEQDHKLNSRRGKKANSSYTASIGLLIAGGKAPPSSDIMDTLQVTAVGLTAIIQLHALMDHLRQEWEKRISFQTLMEQVKDSLQDAIILLKPDLTILDINYPAEQVLGYLQKEAVGHSICDVLVTKDPLDAFLEAAQNSYPSSRLEYVTVYRRSGEWFLANLQILAIRNEERVTHIVILIQDLSEKEAFRKKAEQLEQQALLGDVTASFAHEVRIPINNISTGLQLLEVQLNDHQQQKELSSSAAANLDMVRTLLVECNRLADLIKSGLTFVRQMEYNMAPVDLVKLIQGLLDRMKYRLDRYHIIVQFQASREVPLIVGDARAIEQIFSHIFNNAIEAMSELPEGRDRVLGIKISQEDYIQERPQVAAIVSDTGPGIPEEIREHIFEPFFTTKKNGGTGIGLAVVKRIITAHKGSIQVRSIPGITIFQVYFPVPREPLTQVEASQ